MEGMSHQELATVGERVSFRNVKTYDLIGHEAMLAVGKPPVLERPLYSLLNEEDCTVR